MAAVRYWVPRQNKPSFEGSAQQILLGMVRLCGCRLWCAFGLVCVGVSSFVLPVLYVWVSPGGGVLLPMCDLPMCV